MKKYQVFCLSIFIVLISCGEKEVKKVIVPEKKEETITTPVLKEVNLKPVLIFTVQIGAFKKRNLKFASIKNVQVSSENNMYKYRLGAFKTYKEAKIYQKKMQANYPGAFVQAVKDDNPINIQEAIK